MSSRKVKLLRKYVKRKYKFDYDTLLKGIREEKLKDRIQFMFGLMKRLFFTKLKAEATK